MTCTVLSSLARLATFTGATVSPVLLAGGHVHQVHDGALRIAGVVDAEGTPPAPLRRRVRLYSRATGALVRETWSDAATGAFAFEGLALQQYLVVAHDHTAYFNAVAADLVTPVA